VVGDGDDEALEAWRLRAEEAIGREVSVSSIPYMTRVAERRRRPRLAE